MPENKSKEEIYNESGFPFQNLCLSILKDTKSYQGIPEFPFTHPPSSGNQLGKSSSIDILAVKFPFEGSFKGSRMEASPSIFHGLTLFFIECKRSDPKIKDWIFDKGSGELRAPTFFTKIFKETGKDFYGLNNKISRNGSIGKIGGKIIQNSDSFFQGIEIKSNMTGVNRNEHETIYKSLLQANHAMNALFCKSKVYPLDIEGLHFPKDKFGKILFLPIVVTTANLHVAEYDPKNVDLDTGTIKKENISLSEPKPFIVFDFSLPDYLKHSGEEKLDLLDNKFVEKMLNVERSTTVIVNSKHWKEFLDDFDILSL
ncbi:hypothetical protein ACFLYY_00750 [Patescibacteria group bacterium]